jgi:putative permease
MEGEPRITERESLYRAVLLAAGLLVLGLVFRELVTLMIGILITILFSIPLAAAATRLERRGIPRPIGAFLAMLLILGSLAGLIAGLMPSLIDQTNEFIDSVPEISEDIESEVGSVTGEDPEKVGDEIQSYLEGFGDDPDRLIEPVAEIGLGIAGFLVAAVLGLVTAYYVAVRPSPLVNGALALFPPGRRRWALALGERIRRSWIGWMKGAVIDMLLNGTMVYIGLSLIGLDFALVFGVLAGLLTVIPYFGPIAASIPPILFALADSPEMAVLTAVVYFIVQQIEGNLTIPLVMAQTVRLHPALIAMGVVIVGQLIGFLGLFVAVPILSLIVILVDEIWVKPRDAGMPAGAATAADT